MRAIMVTVVSGILLLSSWENVANARVSAVGARFVAPSRLGPHYNRAFRRWPLYGGFIAVPAYSSDDFFASPPYGAFAPDSSAVDYPGRPAPTQRCENPTHKTVTVPAEAGGTKEITVTYCHP
jgi:hypothetical protein